jgi:hypothetical protein
LAKIEKNWKFKREFETNSQSWKLIEGLTKEKNSKLGVGWVKIAQF